MEERIIIDENQMQRIGDFFIVGTIANRHPDMSGNQISAINIVIVFKESTRRWKELHGGPKSWIIPEHSCRCLIQEIQELTRKGFNITVVSEPEEN